MVIQLPLQSNRLQPKVIQLPLQSNKVYPKVIQLPLRNVFICQKSAIQVAPSPLFRLPRGRYSGCPEAAIQVARVALLGFPSSFFSALRVACVGRPQEVSPCVERIHAKENDQKSDHKNRFYSALLSQGGTAGLLHGGREHPRGRL